MKKSGYILCVRESALSEYWFRLSGQGHEAFGQLDEISLLDEIIVLDEILVLLDEKMKF